MRRCAKPPGSPRLNWRRHWERRRVSKIEHGEVSGIDVVRSYVAALGGTVDVVATLGDRTWRVA